MPAGRDRVRLDALSGFEFEKFCAMVFDRLGYGRVENLPSVGDKGRDLIIHGERKIVVECKHQPKTAVGRPVIQKLHSAVVSERADGGWVVTSGGFTRQATEHADEIQASGIEFKLIDRAMLLDLADRAGIEILGKFDKPVMVVKSPAPDQLIRAVVDAFSSRLTREPSPIRLA
ncbi:MAG: restriction endonuclease, partial [Chloroflexi bacterium]|nr:restriction endonuclease [Chloroflexota bacterium]